MTPTATAASHPASAPAQPPLPLPEPAGDAVTRLIDQRHADHAHSVDTDPGAHLAVLVLAVHDCEYPGAARWCTQQACRVATDLSTATDTDGGTQR